MLASRNTSHICIVSHTWTSGIPGRRVRWSGWRQGWLGRDGETRTCPTWSTVSNHFRFSLQGMEKGYTGCSAGTVKNYLLIAQAIKQPISFDVYHFFRWIRTFWRERAAFQRSAFGRSTAGNDVVATISISLFSFFSPPFFFPFFPFFFLRRDLFL